MSSNTLPIMSPVRHAPVRAAENLTAEATATADGDGIEHMTAAAPASALGLFPSPSPALSGAVGTFGLSAPAAQRETETNHEISDNPIGETTTDSTVVASSASVSTAGKAIT
jgi:hypothetical protein